MESNLPAWDVGCSLLEPISVSCLQAQKPDELKDPKDF